MNVFAYTQLDLSRLYLEGMMLTNKKVGLAEKGRILIESASAIDEIQAEIIYGVIDTW